MADEKVARRLAAILAADMVGYSRLMEADESGTIARQKAHRTELIDPKIAERDGRIVKTTGDGLLAEFPSVVDAVECAVMIQRAMAAREAGISEERRIHYRVGINLGDIVIDGDDILGDGVNVASRLEGLAEPGGICLSGDVYRHVRGKVDAVFVDLGTQSVKNLIEPVHIYGIDIGSPAHLLSKVPEMERVLARPAVAVLPFENLSGDTEQEYFVDGLTEDIITALSQWRSFPVVARNSTFAFKGKSPDVREAGRRLGARYVLEGSVRRGGNRVRVSAQLIDAETGHHVWAERYDRDLNDIFGVQDELTQGIAAVVVPELERVEHKRLIAVTTQHLDAYDCVLRGLACLNAVGEPDNIRAEEMFRRAIQLDPNYGRAYAAYAFVLHRAIMFEYTARTDETLPYALENVRRAIQLDGGDYFAHWVLAALCRWTDDLETGLAEAVRAVELNPSYGHGYNLVGLYLTLLGRPVDAISHIEKAQALCPNDPRLNIIVGYAALANYVARRYGAAIECARRAIQLQPNFPDSHLILAASLGQVDRPKDARASLDACEKIRPGYLDRRKNWFRFRLEKDSKHLLEGLRKAGWTG